VRRRCDARECFLVACAHAATEGQGPLAGEIATWPAIPARSTWSHLFADEADDPVLSWRLELDGEELSMFSMLSTFGTPMDVTLSDLSIELFFPADEHTETILHDHP
jgi:hypothetical protein